MTVRTLFREALELQSVEPMPPMQALEYFRSLLPMLGVDPMRWLADLRRRAFTLAVATNDEMLQRVQNILINRLNTGERISDAPREIEKTLDLMGVTDMPEGYGENVVRTSLMDAFNEGMQREVNQVLPTFPVFRYSNPADSRSRPWHAEKNGLYYPSSVPFVQVRGTESKDIFQCRCVPVYIDKWSWEELKDRGARIAEGYVDPTEGGA